MSRQTSKRHPTPRNRARQSAARELADQAGISDPQALARASSTPSPSGLLDHRAVALTAFRALPTGAGCQYTATTFPSDPYRGCEWFARQCLSTGTVVSPAQDGYAVLDVLDAEGNSIQDFTIPDARAFRYVYRKLKLRVESRDGEDPSPPGLRPSRLRR
jgi:hypothetical protein